MVLLFLLWQTHERQTPGCILSQRFLKIYIWVRSLNHTRFIIDKGFDKKARIWLILFFFVLYFDYLGCYAYAICSEITDAGLHLKCLLRFLVNRHSPPRLNHAPSSYPHCIINLPSHLITLYAFFKLVILKHQPRDVISRWDSNQQRYSPLNWEAND